MCQPCDEYFMNIISFHPLQLGEADYIFLFPFIMLFIILINYWSLEALNKLLKVISIKSNNLG